MSTGFYLMHRGWMDDPVFQNEPFTEREAWCWLIEQASFEPFRYRVQGTQRIVEVKRGQLVTSTRKLAETWQWSVNKVRRYTTLLKNQQMVDTQVDTHNTIITICNYDRFQRPLRNADTRVDTPTDTVTNTRTDTPIYKDVKELKERKEIIPPISPKGGGVSFQRESLEFWLLYPSKVAKQKVIKLYGSILKRGEVTHQQIMAGLREYLKTDKVRRGIVCNPATWLNQQRWLDEPAQIQDSSASMALDILDKLNRKDAESEDTSAIH